MNVGSVRMKLRIKVEISFTYVHLDHTSCYIKNE